MCLPVKDKGRGVDLTGEATDGPALSSGLKDLEVRNFQSKVISPRRCFSVRYDSMINGEVLRGFP